MLSFTQEQIDEYEHKKALIQTKMYQGAALTDDEQYFLCNGIVWDLRSALPECSDVFYYEAFMFRNDPGFRPPGTIYTEENERRFQQLVDDWNNRMNTSGLTDLLMRAEQKEVRLAIKSMKREYNQEDAGYDDQYFITIAGSKFRYLLAKRIFQLSIKSDQYTLWLNGQEILFDYESCIHILARHFGHGMKAFTSEKDHFYGVFRHSHLHLDFEQIFQAIDKSGLYVNDSIQDINFRYKGKLYKIFVVAQKGISNPKKRISTFFPVSDTSILNKLSLNYTEKEVDGNLSIFILKTAMGATLTMGNIENGNIAMEKSDPNQKKGLSISRQTLIWTIIGVLLAAVIGILSLRHQG